MYEDSLPKAAEKKLVFSDHQVDIANNLRDDLREIHEFSLVAFNYN